MNLGRGVEALELPPVVELAKQRLRVPAGSFRDRVVSEMVEDASGDWKDWAVAAIALGLAVLTAVPSGGGSLALGANLAGLALDAYLALEAVDEFSARKAASDTDLDKARSLSQEERSLAWLAVQLVALPVNAGFAAVTFREAASLRRAVRARQPVAPRGPHRGQSPTGSDGAANG